MTDLLQCWHRGYYIEIIRKAGNWVVKDITGEIVWAHTQSNGPFSPSTDLETVADNLRQHVDREVLSHPFTFEFGGRSH